jgi:hypothetical protein
VKFTPVNLYFRVSQSTVPPNLLRKQKLEIKEAIQGKTSNAEKYYA